MQMGCYQRFSAGDSFSCAQGQGKMAVRYTGPSGGHGCKTCPQSNEMRKNTLNPKLKVLQEKPHGKALKRKSFRLLLWKTK